VRSAGALAPAYPDHLRELVESYLEQLRFSTEAPTAGLEEAMRYSLLIGGKRIRPVLALATAAATGMPSGSLLLSAQEGEPASILAAARGLARATGVQGMVGGQYIDVAKTAPEDPAGLRHLHELKTGQLITASIECVLLLGGPHKPVTIASFNSFASELGVLFQIVDDILDVTGSDDTLGKPHGSDERLGKRTYVTEYGLEQARRLAGESHDRARTALAQAAPSGAAELEQITDFIANRSY